MVVFPHSIRWLMDHVTAAWPEKTGPAGARPKQLPPLKYHGRFAIGASNFGARPRGSRLIGKTAASQRAASRNHSWIRGLQMPSTFDTVATIISETCDIPREDIKPESHAMDDLGIDSLDFLDIAFAIDKAFGIKLPIEQWTQEVNDGKATTEQYFVLQNLCARIDSLVSAKVA
jgi:acyl carrier protein